MKQNEVNELLNYGYKIIQNPNYFKYSLDSVLLAEFVKINYKDKELLDICCGNAPIPLILSSKKIHITGVEIQKEIYDLAKETLKINNLSNIDLINDDINNWQNYFPGNNFDIITCNPPYFKYNKESVTNKEIIKSIARHEITITLDNVIKISSKLLKNKGKLYLVHRSERLMEIFDTLHKYNFGIKTLQLGYNDLHSVCSIVLIEAMLNGKDNIKILNPIITKSKGD